MRLWTVQPREVYELVTSAGVYRCDGAKSELAAEFDFEKPYRWMAAQMAKRMGPPPEGVEFPVWAWHTMNGKHRRPDMRWSEFHDEKRPFVLMEVEILDKDVLLSDEELWHFVLNDLYLCNAANKAEADAAKETFDALPEAEQGDVKEKSWERIFSVSPPVDNGWMRAGCFIQATFWELRKEQIVKVWPYQ